MAEAKPFFPVKLICGIIASEQRIFEKAEEYLLNNYGAVDRTSALFKFDFTDYYEKQMGKDLKRKFLSFGNLFPPDKLSEIKLQTNKLEEVIKKEAKAPVRVVNLDPGYLTSSALILATAKDFAHRIPLKNGIYAHLELLFSKKGVRTLSWTYPDYKTEEYQKFFIDVRKIYLAQLKSKA
ncbi:MAG: DUF4416 family protein [Candidatus Aminicenantaceae bacterium]